MFDCSNGIYFRSTSLQTETVHADILRGGPWDSPTVRGQDWVIPGMEGEEVRARIAGYREIELEVNVLTRTTDDFYDELIDLASIFDFSLALGTLELHGPYMGIPAGAVWSIEARAQNMIGSRVQGHMKYQRRSYVLRAPSPDWVLDSGS